MGKKFWKKNVGKINYKKKIFINKIYSNIVKCHTIFALLASFDRRGRKTGSNENVCGIWFKIGNVARSHWTQVWRFERYGSKSAKSISDKVHINQITAPLNCVSTRKSLAHFKRSWQRSRALRAHSAQFKKFKRFINDEMLYRVTNKNHHGKTWSIRQPMLLRLLICRSIMFMRFITRPETICSHLRDPRGLWRHLRGH